jgi:serine/threonine protein kinase
MAEESKQEESKQEEIINISDIIPENQKYGTLNLTELAQKMRNYVTGKMIDGCDLTTLVSNGVTYTRINSIGSGTFSTVYNVRKTYNTDNTDNTEEAIVGKYEKIRDGYIENINGVATIKDVFFTEYLISVLFKHYSDPEYGIFVLKLHDVILCKDPIDKELGYYFVSFFDKADITLRDHIDKMEHIDMGEWVDIFYQIAFALEYFQDIFGFMHRDLNLNNIMLIQKPNYNIYNINTDDGNTDDGNTDDGNTDDDTRVEIKCKYTVVFIDFGFSSLFINNKLLIKNGIGGINEIRDFGSDHWMSYDLLFLFIYVYLRIENSKITNIFEQLFERDNKYSIICDAIDKQVLETKKSINDRRKQISDLDISEENKNIYLKEFMENNQVVQNKEYMLSEMLPLTDTYDTYHSLFYPHNFITQVLQEYQSLQRRSQTAGSKRRKQKRYKLIK